MRKTKYIRDLTVGDTLTDEPFAVKSVINKVASNGKGFRDIVLSDKTGEILGKVWADNLIACDLANIDDVVLVDAEVGEFREARQLNVKKIINNKALEFQPEDFIKSSQKDLAEMLHTIEKNVKKVKDKNLKALLNKFFDDPEFNQRFTLHPAAKMIHHAYLNGLIEHLSEMLNLAEVIAKDFPKLNHDLLIVGILLHDIGKLDELSYNRVIDISTKGRLLGHVSMSAFMVRDAIHGIKKFPEELEWQVLHLILSHHGDLSLGSPVVPMTTEALALTQLDQLSSKVNIAYLKTEELVANANTFSEGIFGLNNNRIYNPNNIEDSSADLNTQKTTGQAPTLF
jgi:3'-5' exoribonuclease